MCNKEIWSHICQYWVQVCVTNNICFGMCDTVGLGPHTLEPVLQDHTIGHRNVSQDRQILVIGSITFKYNVCAAPYAWNI